MKQINTEKWKEFHVYDLFSTIVTGPIKSTADLEEGQTPIISSSAYNQGVAMYANIDAPFKNYLTVSYRGGGFVSYHSENFNATLNCGILLHNFEMTENVGLFLATYLTKQLSKKYNYKHIITPGRLLTEKIKLPADPNGDPDWAYIENYMKMLKYEVSKRIRNIELVKLVHKSICKSTSWKLFKVKDLFDIHPTKAYKLTNKELMDNIGKNPVIVNSGYNNGIGGFTKMSNTENGNIITFSDTTSGNTFFYQENDFVGYAHIQGLYPIGSYKDKWTKYSYLFLVSQLKTIATSLNFDYSNKLTRDAVSNFELLLPIDSQGNLDIVFMEEYMKSIEIQVNSILNNLN